jgi:hypothetical protein
MAKKTKTMLEPKRILRVGADYLLGFVRAAAEGTKEFVDARERKEALPESASSSVAKFFESASEGVDRANDTLTREREAQDRAEEPSSIRSRRTTRTNGLTRQEHSNRATD